MPLTVLTILVLKTAWLLLSPPLPLPQQSQRHPAIILSGFSDSEIFAIRDSVPLATEDPNLRQLLYRVQAVSQKTLQKHSDRVSADKLATIMANPRSHRCYLYSMSGSVQSISAFSGFEIVHLTLEGRHCLIAVASSDRPQRWPINESINQPVTLTGFYLGNYDFHLDNLASVQIANLKAGEYPLFVAGKISWRPVSRSDRFEITESELLLAKYGVDLARLDHVRKNILGRIGSGSASSFYQFLQATNQMLPAEFPADTIDFKNCLRAPVKHQSAPMRLHGHVRQVTEILVDEEFRHATGIDRYYQLDMFLPLGSHKIVFRNGRNADQPATVIENRFPIIVCVPSLPAPAKEIEGQMLTVPAFFFQRWHYVSEQSKQNPLTAFQDAPLAIGLQPQLPPPSSTGFATGVTVAVVVGIAGIATLYFFFGRFESTKKRLQPKLDLADFGDDNHGSVRESGTH